jgi:hypothetical protein
MSSVPQSLSPPPSCQEIARDATWLLQALDPQAKVGRLIRMDATAYREASFLDDRMLQTPQEMCVVPWDGLADAAAAVEAPPARWIFHLGHVGSTLVARLLGELPTVLSVREPRALRDLTTAPDLARPVSRLMARTLAPGQASVVKATSFVSEIAPVLIEPDGKALFMMASPRRYIASILAGENSVKELHALASTRALRAQARGLTVPVPQSNAELAAIAWASSISALEAAALSRPDVAITWVDFDDWLEEADLGPIAAALDLEADPARVAELQASHLLTRYSKSTDYEYSPRLRRQLIADATAAHRRDVDRGVALLEKMAASSPLMATALGRSKGA